MLSCDVPNTFRGTVDGCEILYQLIGLGGKHPIIIHYWKRVSTIIGFQQFFSVVYRISQPSGWLSEARRAFALGVIREAVVQWQQHGDETNNKKRVDTLFICSIVIMVIIVIYSIYGIYIYNLYIQFYVDIVGHQWIMEIRRTYDG